MHLISAKDLTLTYQDVHTKIHAVDNVEINLPTTGLFGILGPSGSGKTSLLYLLSGIKKPTHGNLLYKDQPYPKNPNELSRLRRQKMGFVFQQHFLINYLSTLQNISVGATPNTKPNDLSTVVNRLGLNKLENRKPYELSGGQRQRVAIARAIVNHPEIIFVDEPTASLDHTNGTKVMEYFYELSRELCIVVVTHDPSILSTANRIYEMSDGRLK